MWLAWILIAFGSWCLWSPTMFAKLCQLDVGGKLKQHLRQLDQWHGMKDSPVLWRNGNHHPIVSSGDIPVWCKNWNVYFEARFLQRWGLLEHDADDCMDAGGRATQGAVAENSYLAGEVAEAGPLDQLRAQSITYRIAVGPQAGRKVFTLQSLPACDESFNDPIGKVAGFPLHAGVLAEADEREKQRNCLICGRKVREPFRNFRLDRIATQPGPAAATAMAAAR